MFRKLTQKTKDSALILSRAVAIEQTVYRDNGEKIEAGYKARIRTLFSNLKAKGNPSLRDAVVSGHLKVEKISRMSTQVNTTSMGCNVVTREN